jgi:ParB family chromosome partitioning protein
MGSKLYGAEGRGDVLNFKPEMLSVITDPKHPLYDERIELPVDEAMVLSIMRRASSRI